MVAGPGRAAEHPALAEGRAERAAAVRCASVSMPSASTQAPLRSAWALTACMTSAVALVGDALDQRQVELDDVGEQQGHEGQRGRLGTHVVEGDAPAQLPHPGDSASGAPLGAPQPPARSPPGRPGRPSRRRARGERTDGGEVQDLWLDVDEDRRGGLEAACAARRAAVRQARSSSASRPALPGRVEQGRGTRNGPSGPRARASCATTSPVTRSTMGWNTVWTASSGSLRQWTGGGRSRCHEAER